MNLGPWAISDMWQNASLLTGWGPNDYTALCLKYNLKWAQYADEKWRKACADDAAYQMALESSI